VAILRKLPYRHIVYCKDFFEEGSMYYMVLEYMDGAWTCGTCRAPVRCDPVCAIWLYLAVIRAAFYLRPVAVWPVPCFVC